MVFKRCPKGYKRHGCCTCVLNCPDKFRDSGFHCKKPKFKIMNTYKSIKECSDNAEQGCVPFGFRFAVPSCGEYYERVGATMCVPVCPLGWKDEGKRCQKPGTFHNGPPFTWSYGDEPHPGAINGRENPKGLSQQDDDGDTENGNDEDRGTGGDSDSGGEDN